MLTLSKSPFPSLPITVGSLRCNTVTQPGITHQQERQIPALWDSCFMPRITNWIVWGSIIYLNTKMQSYSLLFYEVSTFILKYTNCCVVKRTCFEKTKMNSDCWASTTCRAWEILLLQVTVDKTRWPRNSTHRLQCLSSVLYEVHWTYLTYQARSI